MAFTPCAFHGKGYAGAASTFFLRLVRGGDQIGGKLQVCPNCATTVLDELAEHYTKVSEGEEFFLVPEFLSCSACCGELNAGSFQFYGNAYPRGKRESQWYGRVCVECVPAVTEVLHLDKAQVRP